MSKERIFKYGDKVFKVEICESIDNFPSMEIYEQSTIDRLENNREWKQQDNLIYSNNPCTYDYKTKITWIEEIEELENAIAYFKKLCKEFPKCVYKKEK